MNNRPCILITNDDGIDAPGIQYLWRSLLPHAELFVVAPATEQSGKSLSISFFSTLHITQYSWEKTSAWSVSGSPADCVKAAVSILLPKAPDLIVSGINQGSNAGRAVLYSGTVGGVIEGILRGIPGIAFSSYDFYQTEYQAFTSFIPVICDYVLTHPMPRGTLLNVNFPSTQQECSVPQGIKLTRQGKQYWIEDPVSHDHSFSYSFDVKLQQFDEHEESDIFWLERGYITAVPIHVDELTDWQYLQAKKAHFEEFTKSRLNN